MPLHHVLQVAQLLELAWLLDLHVCARASHLGQHRLLLLYEQNLLLHEAYLHLESLRAHS